MDYRYQQALRANVLHVPPTRGGWETWEVHVDTIKNRKEYGALTAALGRLTPIEFETIYSAADAA